MASTDESFSNTVGGTLTESWSYLTARTPARRRCFGSTLRRRVRESRVRYGQSAEEERESTVDTLDRRLGEQFGGDQSGRARLRQRNVAGPGCRGRLGRNDNFVKMKKVVEISCF